MKTIEKYKIIKYKREKVKIVISKTVYKTKGSQGNERLPYHVSVYTYNDRLLWEANDYAATIKEAEGWGRDVVRDMLINPIKWNVHGY
jgi:hypothetical protein